MAPLRAGTKGTQQGLSSKLNLTERWPVGLTRWRPPHPIPWTPDIGEVLNGDWEVSGGSKPEKEAVVAQESRRVVRLLRGESLDGLSRELRVEGPRPPGRRDEFLAGGIEGTKAKPPQPEDRKLKGAVRKGGVVGSTSSSGGSTTLPRLARFISTTVSRGSRPGRRSHPLRDSRRHA